MCNWELLLLVFTISRAYIQSCISIASKHGDQKGENKQTAYTNLPALPSLCYVSHSVQVPLHHLCQLFYPSWRHEEPSSSLDKHSNLTSTFLNRRLKFDIMATLDTRVLYLSYLIFLISDKAEHRASSDIFSMRTA